MRIFKNQKKNKFLLGFGLGLVLFVSLFLFSLNTVSAQDTFGLQAVGDNINLGAQDIRVTIGKIVRAVLGLLGVIAVVIVLYGGFVYMTSAGNEEKVTQGKKILINGIIGLAIILSALTITQFVLNKLSEAINPRPPIVNENCRNLDYAFAHPEECGDNFCTSFPEYCSCADQHFVIQSITPRTDNTQMNNAKIRIVFSKRIQGMSSATIANYVNITYNGATSTDFSFQILGNVTPDKNAVIEASYKDVNLPAGDYEVVVSPEIKDASGRVLETNTDCGVFGNSAEFKILTDGVIDSVAPVASPIVIRFVNDQGQLQELTDFKLVQGESYFFETNVTDNSGAGYVDMKIEKLGAINNKIYGYFDGPTIVRGSDASVSSPYLFSHRRYFPTNTNVKDTYLVTLTVFDIDNNSTTITALFTVVPPHCKNNIFEPELGEISTDIGGTCPGGDGDVCLSDLDCAYSYRCLDTLNDGKKYCTAVPLIEEVDPMAGAGGNWVTIIGRNFGANIGKVEFGYDRNGDGEIPLNDVDEWTEASVVSCGPQAKQSWSDSWAIVEVPLDNERLPLYSTSTIRLTVDYDISEDFNYDLTTNDWGTKPGDKNGWFTKNNESLPGLCLVAVTENLYDNEDRLIVNAGATAAPPDTVIRAYGKGLGLEKGDSNLYFSLGRSAGFRDSPVRIRNRADWTETEILTRVPNLAVGTYGVYAAIVGSDEQTKRTNKVPFGIFNLGDFQIPVISGIDPATTTPGSYITITGEHFGDMPGQVYLSTTAGGTDYTLNISLPAFCGQTWTNRQVVAEVPENFPLSGFTQESTLEYDFLQLAGENAPYAVNSAEQVLAVGGAISGYAFNEDFILNIDLELQEVEIPVNLTSLERLIVRKDNNSNNDGGDYRISILDERVVEGGVKRSFVIGSVESNADDLVIPLPDNGLRQEIIVEGRKSGFLEVKAVDHSEEGNPLKVVFSEDSFLELNPIISDGLLTIGGMTNGDFLLQGKINVLKQQKKLVSIGSGSFYLTLERGDNNLRSSGNDLLGLESGAGKPSLCNLRPSSGPAPTPNGDSLELFGVNFSNSPAVFFWRDVSQLNNLSTWLAAESLNLSSVVSGNKTGNKIITAIPYHEDEYGGYTMQSGPVKVLTNQGVVSNGLNYEVNDCRQADTALIGRMDSENMRCCEAEGKDTGKWKSKVFACEGESRDAGYVWRFTTGKISGLPYVVEECDQEAWATSRVIPSPVPWDNWEEGTETCLNADIAVRFSVPMDEASASPDTVKLYSCQGTVTSHDCQNAEPIILSANREVAGAGGYLYWENNVLYIHTPLPRLRSNTWYHVEILGGDNGLKSAEEVNEIGESIGQQNLLATRSCDELGNNENTAYCYDFRTGDGLCSVLGAGINPSEYTTYLLGMLQNPQKPYDSVNIFNPLNPYYYYLWGKGNQKCSILNVDGLGWQWGSSNISQAESNKAPSNEQPRARYTDTRATVTALANTVPGVVNILASTTTLDTNLEITENPKNIGGVSLMELSGVGITDLGFDLKQSPNNRSFLMLDSVTDLKSPFTMEIKFKLEGPVGGTIGAQYLLNKVDAYSLLYMNGDNGTGLCISSPNFPGTTIVCNRETPVVGQVYRYIFTWDGVTGTWYNSRGYMDARPFTVSSSENPLYIGYSNYAALADYVLYDLRLREGVLDTSTIDLILNPPIEEESEVPPGMRKIEAISPLTIDLSNPKVIDYWPNCEEACVNSSVGVRFNQMMMTSTYHSGLRVYKCLDVLCNTFLPSSSVTLNIEPDTAEPLFVLRANPEFPGFTSSTWYRAEISDDIKSIGAFRNGVAVEGESVEDFVWRFRTKADGTPCLAEKIEIKPNPFVATYISQKNLYSAIPKGAPDQCNTRGQELNPWWFGWSWSSSDTRVAEISDFASSKSNKDYCTLGCLFRGSDIAKDSSNNYFCGNSVVDPGEDCDIGKGTEGHRAGIDCTYDCLKINKTNTGSSATPPSGQIGVAWCGDGVVTAGEDCDTAMTVTAALSLGHVEWSQVGCSAKCLHTGTPLAQSWCQAQGDEEGNNIVACKKSLSICGNSVLELGEECEIGIAGATVENCDNNCLLFGNVCDTTPGKSGLEQCLAGEKGCTDGCLLQGSSLGYSTPSLCGDGEIGFGEDSRCEAVGGLPADINIKSPVQVATAIGLGPTTTYNNRLAQRSDISAIATHFLALNNNQEIVYRPITTNEGGPKTGKGDYYLQCGNTEYRTPQLISQPEDIKKVYSFNDCNNNEGNVLGVGANSCCYARAVRESELPHDGAGLGRVVLGEDGKNIYERGVCRNPYIEVTFDKEIDARALRENVILVAGYTGSDDIETCLNTPNTLDRTGMVRDSLGQSGEISQSSLMAFIKNIWLAIKNFFVRLLNFDQALASGYASNLPVINKWCSGAVSLSPEVYYEYDSKISATSTIVSLYVSDLLEADRAYALVVRGGLNGVRDIQGVGIKSKDDANQINDVWIFKTGKDICKIKEVTVAPDAYLFDRPYTTSTFRANIESTNGQRIVRTPVYNWRWYWAPQGHPVFEIPLSGTPLDTDRAIIGAKNVEGSVLAVAQAIVTEDKSETDNHKGKVFTGLSSLTAKFCENPWPAREGNSWEPFKDLYFNFSMSYCADAGRSGITTDDLPYFTILTVTSSSELAEDILRRYLFFASTTEDAIGLQVFKNETRLSAAAWFKNKFPDAQTQLQNVNVAGYQGVSDGNNYYINAKNIERYRDSVRNIWDYRTYDNIYQFSLNQNAQADSRQVLEQLLGSLEYNINLTDHGYCLQSAEGIENEKFPAEENLVNAITDIRCTTDFECHNVDGALKEGTNGVCSLAKTKFFRDLSRLSDIQTIQNNLDKHFNTYYNTVDFRADLRGGTYIPGYTNSRWPSWNNTLGAAVGNLPLEKINSWTTCGDNTAESQTCWNASASTYSCPAFAQIYEYEFVSSTASYLLHGPLEFLTEDNNLVKDAINEDKFTTVPVCRGQIVSPVGKQCGDGIIQPGETCEPPNSTKLSRVGATVESLGSCDYESESVTCASEADCPQSVFWSPNNATVPFYINQSADKKICQYNTDLYGPEILYGELRAGNELQVFGCESDSACQSFTAYGEGTTVRNLQGTMEFTIENDFGLSPDEKFVCLPAGDSYQYDNTIVASCEGGVVGGQQEICQSGSIATTYCNENCQQVLGACLSVSDCGNGIVEVGEACDDGKLNGTYGNCNATCSDLHPDFCGNNRIDTLNGRSLELCEKISEQQVVYYKDSSAQEAVRMVCNDFVRDGNDLLVFYALGCKNFTKVCQNDKKILCNVDADCNNAPLDSARVVPKESIEEFNWGAANNNYGPCVDLKYGPDYTYSKNKQLSCSWDCQNTGSYCGDGRVDSYYGEECDDGNTDNNDSCNNLCNLNSAPSVCGNGVEEAGEECDDGNTKKGDGCSDICKDEPPEYKTCGDGVVDTDLGEVCDTGKENLGVACDPEYGKSCTYCSVDCKKVLTKDAVAYCGNGLVDFIDFTLPLWETCDVRNDKVITKSAPLSPEIVESCDDKGVYTCGENCRSITSNCVSCGNLDKNTGGTLPYLRIVNPVQGNASWWTDMGGQDQQMKGNYAYLYRINPPGLTGWAQFLNSNPQGLAYSVFNPGGSVLSDEPMQYIQPSSLCKDEYKVFFNTRQLLDFIINPTNPLYSSGITTSSFMVSNVNKLGDFFDFPVNNERPQVTKEMIVSPPVLPGQFRIVARWTDKENDLDASFRLSVKNVSVYNNNVLRYVAAYPNKYCNSQDLAVDCSDKNFDGVYIHQKQSGETIFTQAITIDTSFITSGSYLIFVESDDIPTNMYKYRDSELQVEVYANRPGQNDLYSIFKPIKTFSIKSIGAGNPDARFWQVFNLVKNDDKYEIGILPHRDPSGQVIGTYPNGTLITEEKDLINT